MLLPDINVWLALTFDSHVHHPAAKSWFDGLSNDTHCYFCRLTQIGFLRLATNKSVFGKETLTLLEAWQAYDQYVSDPRIALVNEPAGCEFEWRNYTQGRSFSPQVWNDAYLAGFAKNGGLEIVTFDKGFAKFPNVNCTILS